MAPVRKRQGRGLSPRVRGNRNGACTETARQGSIPACAGEPRRLLTQANVRRVYPRVCGGTASSFSGPAAHHGLSPRVRGNLNPGWGAGVVPGSIPACAGEPFPASAAAAPRSVYPRVCGGTLSASNFDCLICGLSPRVRGNPLQARSRSGRGRSIPACAGEPKRRTAAAAGRPVYPRVCGGTVAVFQSDGLAEGLSPRVRGNLMIPLYHR